MARATIPYTAIEQKVREMFPYPTYQGIEIIVPTRYNDVKAPTTVYDRRTGNYKSIGYRIRVRLTRFVGFREDFRPLFERDEMMLLVEV
jgi:hypothetical protein